MAKKVKGDIEPKILDVDASMQGTISFKEPVSDHRSVVYRYSDFVECPRTGHENHHAR